MEDAGITMKNSIIFALFGVMLWSASSARSFGQEEGPFVRGGIILANLKVPVAILDADGNPLAPEKIKAGVLLTDGYSVDAGEGGEAILLFSNGTLVTVAENTKIKLESFLQEPFDAGEKKLEDLQEEPSSSSGLINLEIGSLVVKTKKLNKKSNFEISSPVGTAGIRGTQFGMGFSPNRGMSLDVTESTVSFSPRGGGRPSIVRAGRGLTAPPRGVPSPRAANPVATRNINSTNDRANRSTRKLPLRFVNKSMKRATTKKPPSRREREGKRETRTPGGQVSPEDGPKREEPKPNEDGPGAKPSEEGSQAGGAKDVGPKPKPVLPKALASTPMRNAPKNLTNEALENNFELTQARKVSKVSKMTKTLARFALSAEQTNFFYSLSPEAQSTLMAESPEIAGRVLRMDGMSMSNAFAFFSYTPDVRAKILGLSDEAAVQILDQGLGEGLMLATLNDQSLSSSGPENIPTIDAPEVSDQRILALAEKLKDSGNREVMDELQRLSGGVITEDLLRKGEAGAILLNDYAFSGAAGSGPSAQPASEVLGNPFYKEITSLFQKLESDYLVAGSPDFVGGRNLIIPANTQGLSPYLIGANGKTIALSASENLAFEGDFEWGKEQEDSARLVVMSGGAVTLAKGMTLKSATSDLLLSSREDLLMDGVKVEVSKEALVRGMRDVTLNNIEIGADTMATIKATRNLNVDGLIFSRGVSNILMEATTVRLSNVNFPAASMIKLNSLKGPIDGKYPNFGTAVPAAQQVGRVNFIQNVSSGGNALNTRQAFDTYGNNISIGKASNL
jgi:hypothetical protein